MGGDSDVRAKLGACISGSGAVFCVWAPFADAVWVMGDFNAWSRDTTPLAHTSDGYWVAEVANAKAGEEYKYIIKHGEQLLERNDPRALQLTSSGDSSILVDTVFNWENDTFQLAPPQQLVLYELHVGTFARSDAAVAGTFRDAIAKLDYLAQLGINAIEVMPCNAVWMDRWWGYTPDNIYAVESAYGGRRAFMEFVREAHARDIGVILDVVYNHLSHDPGLDLWQFDGWNENNLGGIYFYNDWRSHTPWGEGRPDYGRSEVRGYITDNVTMWLRDCHVDGLRVDATLYIRNAEGKNNDPDHDIADGWKLLQEVTTAAALATPHAFVIAEDLQGNAWITKPVKDGGAGFNSQWDPSFAAIMREVLGPPLDESRQMDKIKSALLAQTNGDPFERVIYSESHDTDAEANGGTRLDEAIEPGHAGGLYARRRCTLAAALLMTAPGVPMIFQGQEFQEGGVFSHYAPLDWENTEQYQGMVALYTHLIALRQNRYNNTAGLLGKHVDVFMVDDSTKLVAFRRWDAGGIGDDVVVLANFANTVQNVALQFPASGNWRVRLSTDWKGYADDFTGITPEVISAEVKDEGNVGVVDIAPYSVLIFSQDS